MRTYKFHQGRLPLLISMPHNGTEIPLEMKCNMSAHGSRLVDTDWFLDKLYSFACPLGCSVLCPLYSRYVIDLNRHPQGKALYNKADNTELCPLTTFEYQRIYECLEPGETEVADRIERYFKPYHDRISSWISETKKHFGFAVLFDVHSIKSQLPRFFEGRLPELNLGTMSANSCHPELEKIMASSLKKSGYTFAHNERFKGGYITRHYGKPAENVFSVQLEIAQNTYLNEKTFEIIPEKFEQLQKLLRRLVEKMISWMKKYGRF